MCFLSLSLVLSGSLSRTRTRFARESADSEYNMTNCKIFLWYIVHPVYMACVLRCSCEGHQLHTRVRASAQLFDRKSIVAPASAKCGGGKGGSIGDWAIVRYSHTPTQTHTRESLVAALPPPPPPPPRFKSLSVVCV